MKCRLIPAWICAAAVLIGSAARAADEAPPPPAPPPPPPAASRVKVFLISPEESDQNFMCESGHVQSVRATAIAEHRVVSIIFLDQSGNPIPVGVWSSAYGFRLAHRQTIKVEAAMFCGN
jgi:hypothetical protein